MSSKKHTYDHLRIEKSGHIASLIFDREEKANALSRAFLIEIKEACLSFAQDIDTRVVIFSGRGKHFSSGADLSSSPNKDASRLKKATGRQSRRGGNPCLFLTWIKSQSHPGTALRWVEEPALLQLATSGSARQRVSCNIQRSILGLI